jgi:hypothetical protein
VDPRVAAPATGTAGGANQAARQLCRGEVDRHRASPCDQPDADAGSKAGSERLVHEADRDPGAQGDQNCGAEVPLVEPNPEQINPWAETVTLDAEHGRSTLACARTLVIGNSRCRRMLFAESGDSSGSTRAKQCPRALQDSSPGPIAAAPPVLTVEPDPGRRARGAQGCVLPRRGASRPRPDPRELWPAGTVTFAGWHSGGWGYLDHQSRQRLPKHVRAPLAHRRRCRPARQRRDADWLRRITGHSSGPHLHFELRLNDASVDPTRALSLVHP